MRVADEPKTSRPTLFLLLVSLAAGCATVYPPEQGIVSDAPLDQEGIVFGTLTSGDPKDQVAPGFRYSINFGPRPDAANPVLRSWLIHGHTMSPVFFAIRLPAGDYYVSGLHAGNANANLKARFTVASNKATYIGSLRVAFFAGEPGLLGGSTTRVGIRATNDLDEALQQYRQRNPRLPYEITTNLMTFGG